jgi:DNA-directed RNA polymerase specialized sigma24 family protein
VDEAEYTAWVTGVQHQLLRSAYLVTGDLHRAEDLVQDALVKVALRWSRLRDGNPTAYARTIMMNQNVSWWRRRRREVLTDDVRDAGDRPVETEDQLVVRRALGRLT